MPHPVGPFRRHSLGSTLLTVVSLLLVATWLGSAPDVAQATPGGAHAHYVFDSMDAPSLSDPTKMAATYVASTR